MFLLFLWYVIGLNDMIKLPRWWNKNILCLIFVWNRRRLDNVTSQKKKILCIAKAKLQTFSVPQFLSCTEIFFQSPVISVICLDVKKQNQKFCFIFLFYISYSLQLFTVQVFFVRLAQSIKNWYFCVCRKWLQLVKTNNIRKLHQTKKG